MTRCEVPHASRDTTKSGCYAAFVCVLVGLLVSVLLAPKDSFLLPNVAFFWLPQLGVLIVTWLLKSRAAIVSGVASALAIYLAAFGAWVFTRVHPDSMAWLGYIFSMPGAAAGAFVAWALLRHRTDLRPLVAGSVAGGVVLVGIALNQAAICTTVMYCLGK